MHTLPHSLEGQGVVRVLVARGRLLLLEHYLGPSVESLEIMVLFFRKWACNVAT